MNSVKKNLKDILAILARFSSHSLFVLYLLFSLFPLYWIITLSLKPRDAIIQIPPPFLFSATIANFKNILIDVFAGGESIGTSSRVNIPITIMNSSIIVGASVAFSLIVGIPAGYAFAKKNFLGKENIAFTILSIRFAPALMVIVPLLAIFRNLGLVDTYIGMIFAYQLITLPMVVWIMRSFFEDIPDSIIESAEIDGSNIFQKFIYVLIPMAKPGIGASATLSFIFAWQQLTFPLILGGTNTEMVTLGMLGFIGYERVMWGNMAAAIVISVLPTLLIAAFFQQYIVSGMTLGAVKS